MRELLPGQIKTSFLTQTVNLMSHEMSVDRGQDDYKFFQPHST